MHEPLAQLAEHLTLIKGSGVRTLYSLTGSRTGGFLQNLPVLFVLYFARAHVSGRRCLSISSSMSFTISLALMPRASLRRKKVSSVGLRCPRSMGAQMGPPDFRKAADHLPGKPLSFPALLKTLPPNSASSICFLPSY